MKTTLQCHAALFLALLCLSSAAFAAPREWHLIVTDARNVDELRDRIRPLEAAGASIRHFIPPNLAFGHVPLAVDPDRISEARGRVQVLRDGSDAGRAGDAPTLGEAYRRGAGIWAALQETRVPGHGDDLAGDGLAPDAALLAELAAAADVETALPSCGLGGGISEYFLNDISIAIVLMESVSIDPVENTENWSVARQDQVVAEIMSGADTLAGIYPYAGLDFFYEVRRDVPTEVEPIVHDSAHTGLWVGEAMVSLGHPSVSSYARSVRTAHGTDWASVAFIADSLVDADGKFPNGRFAFAYIGGPYMVMTYDNDGWGIGGTDTVWAHELGHNFRALDEYASAGVACDRRSGVLNIENQNSAIGGCLGSDSCIMRANGIAGGYCFWSIGQLGLPDSDLNGVPDLRDSPPQSEIVPLTPNPTSLATATVTGSATARPNATEFPLYSGHTLNTLARVEYRLDGGPWVTTDPVASPWDSTCEDFTLDLAGLSEGWHDIETRAFSNVCDPDDLDICSPPIVRGETSYPLQRLYVNTDCSEDLLEPNDNTGEAVSIPAGVVDSLQLCAYDVDYFRLFLRGGASLGVRAEYSDPTANVTLELKSPLGARLDLGLGVGGVATVSMATAPGTGWYTLGFAGVDDDESAYRLVVTASCIDDRLEPSVDAATGPLVGAGLTPDLQLCAADEDWYRISVSAGASLDVSINHTAALGDLDLELRAPDSSLIDRSATAGDLETVSGVGLTAGVHSVRVVGASPTAANRYDFTLTTDRCLDDLAENDDDPATARVGLGRFDGRICPSDEDWTRFDLTRPSLVRATIGYPAAGVDLQLEIRDLGGVVIARAAGSNGLKSVDIERVLPGTYYARVFTTAAGENSYSVTLEQADPILLYGVRENDDVVLDWNDAGVDCYWIRRSTVKQTFDGGFETVLDLAVPGDETGHDPTSWIDADKIPDGVLYYYNVLSTACGSSLLSATKIADPYPVLEYEASIPPLGKPLTYTITVRNNGRDPATSITVYDDVPPSVTGFTVLEIPVGATDNSSPTGGRWGGGYVKVDGFTLAPEEAGVVRFEVGGINGPTGANGSVDRNQARVTGLGAAGQFLDTVTDDPSTHAAFDSTDVMRTNGKFPLSVSMMFNQDVNIDIRVVDPCGNLIGPADFDTATCPAGIPGGLVTMRGGCGDVWPWGWAEAIQWQAGIADPSRGDYEVFIRYTESSADGGTCRHGGLEDAVVLIERWSTWSHHWVVLDPSVSDWVYVTTVTVP